MSIRVDEQRSSVREEGRVTLRCTVEARPANDVTFKWTWDGEGADKRLQFIDKQVLSFARYLFAYVDNDG